MKLVVELDVPNKIEAYRAVTRMGFKFKVLKATLENKEYGLQDEKVKNFLKDKKIKPKEL